MTLVVGCVRGQRVAIAADTLLTEHGMPLPAQQGAVKSCVLPGDICVSFSNSPELADAAFRDFATTFRDGTTFAEVISFFENSSAITGNDYLIAFARPARLIKIADGKRRSTLTDYAWIGDTSAYSRFREYLQRKCKRPQAGRAINAAYFADELENSPASDLFSALRNVISDNGIKSVGGFVSVISNRDDGFRHSVYCDMLYDWPAQRSDDYELRYEDPIAFTSTGENARYAVAQISSGYIGANIVAFFVAKARKLFLFYSDSNSLPLRCRVFSEISAPRIAETLSAFVGTDLGWLATVTAPLSASALPRSQTMEALHGAQLVFHTEVNTFPRGA